MKKIIHFAKCFLTISIVLFAIFATKIEFDRLHINYILGYSSIFLIAYLVESLKDKKKKKENNNERKDQHNNR